MENASLTSKCARIRKEHAETAAKYRETHAKYESLVEAHMKMVNEFRAMEESYNKRLNDRKKEICTLNQSLLKRIKEKDEAIQQIETLTQENAELLQIHADLAQESAALKKENDALVNTVYPLETKVKELEAENASLRQLREADAKDRKDYDAIKAERDELRKQIEAQGYERKGDDRKRGRSYSRSPPRHSRPHLRSRSATNRSGHGRVPWSSSYRSRSRDGNDSRERVASRERSYRTHVSYDVLASEKHHPYTPVHLKESNGMNHQDSEQSSKSLPTQSKSDLNPCVERYLIQRIWVVQYSKRPTSRALFAFWPKEKVALQRKTCFNEIWRLPGIETFWST